MFKLDGVTYSGNVLLKDGIERNFSVLDSDKSGRVSNGTMNRDVIGTFYNYTLKIDRNGMTNAEYDEFYENISSPVESHSWELPYAQGNITFDGYVTSGKDVLNVNKDGTYNWDELSINIIAMSPLRRPS